MVTPGRWSSSPRLTSGLTVTPDDVIARSDERSQRSGCGVERVEQRAGEHVADDGEHLHAFALDRVPDQLGIEAGVVDEHDGAAAGERRRA